MSGPGAFGVATGEGPCEGGSGRRAAALAALALALSAALTLLAILAAGGSRALAASARHGAIALLCHLL
jgi:hypothetical protein